MLVDTHCHVHFNAYKEDMDDVIKRTLEEGVFMITVGTQKDTSQKGLDVAQRFDGLWASVGLHPNHLVEQSFWDDDELPADKQATPKIKTRAEAFDYDLFKKMTEHPKCVAIGETGLDFYRIPDGVDREAVVEKQKEVFRQHAELATESNLPLIIHCRDAYPEQADLVAELIDQGKLPRRGVVHCFSGNLEEAQRFINLGFYISFTGTITFPRRKKDETVDGLSQLQYAVKELPLEKILVETDSPYLTPIPNRGKRNEPSYVKYVAKKIAELKGISFQEVEEVTTKNAKKLFSI